MKQRFSLSVVLLLFATCSSALLTSCKKSNADSTQYGNTPRTNPLPAELAADWQMTTSGGGYIYDGVHYGSSGNGAEVNLKTNGTGWWNTIYQVASPGCVLVQNLSTDCTFRLHQEDGVDMLYAYIVAGTLHEEKCSSPDVDIDLKAAGKTYPAYPPLMYYYKITAADNDPSLKLLLLSQDENESTRFDAHEDAELIVLKRLG